MVCCSADDALIVQELVLLLLLLLLFVFRVSGHKAQYEGGLWFEKGMMMMLQDTVRIFNRGIKSRTTLDR